MSISRLLESRSGAVGLIAAVLLIGAFASQSGAAANKDVRVVNTADEAVPVAPQGTTQVAGTVAIGNTPTVTVGNSSSEAIPVTSVDPAAATEPFSIDLVFGFSGDDGNTTATDSFTVPDGKRFVVEFVSGEFPYTSGRNLLKVSMSAPAGEVSLPVLTNPTGEYQVVNDETRLIVGPGESLHGVAEVDTEAEEGFFFNVFMTVSGVLIDA